MADHGFAGAAIEAGVETLSIADVNDPALIVAQAQGRTDVVVVMDDHVDPERLLALLPGPRGGVLTCGGPHGHPHPADLGRSNWGYPPTRPPPTIRPS